VPTAKRSSLREEGRNLKKRERAEGKRFLFDAILAIGTIGQRHLSSCPKLRGLRGKFRDFLFSPVLGGELIREPGKASA
jgi:hypothetical protein